MSDTAIDLKSRSANKCMSIKFFLQVVPFDDSGLSFIGPAL